MSRNFRFDVEIDTDTGDILAAYFQVRTGKVHTVKEHAGGAVLANYNRKGELLGIEVIAPCRVSILDRIGRQDSQATRKFFRNALPRELVEAS